MQNNEIKLKELIKQELDSRKGGNKGTFSHSVGWPLYDERELYAALDYHSYEDKLNRLFGSETKK